MSTFTFDGPQEMMSATVWHSYSDSPWELWNGEKCIHFQSGAQDYGFGCLVQLKSLFFPGKVNCIKWEQYAGFNVMRPWYQEMAAERSVSDSPTLWLAWVCDGRFNMNPFPVYFHIPRLIVTDITHNILDCLCIYLHSNIFHSQLSLAHLSFLMHSSTVIASRYQSVNLQPWNKLTSHTGSSFFFFLFLSAVSNWKNNGRGNTLIRLLLFTTWWQCSCGHLHQW